MTWFDADPASDIEATAVASVPAIDPDADSDLGPDLDSETDPESGSVWKPEPEPAATEAAATTATTTVTATRTSTRTTVPPPASTTIVEAIDPAKAVRERRRSVRGVAREDIFALVGSFAAAVAITAIVFVWLAPFDNPVGFVICLYFVFLLCYGVAVSQDHDGPAVRDRMVGAVVHGLALVLFGSLVFVIAFTAVHGATALHHLNFYTQDMRLTPPAASLTSGGVKHAIVGSLIEIGLALIVTVPLGILTAVMLNEIPGRTSRLVRTIAEAATALPSIVAGLFIYAVLLVPFGNRPTGILQKGGLAAACAISIMMLPIVIRASDVVLRLVPGNLKEASYALGAGQWPTVWRVTLPTARSGLATAVILGTARGIGETSPVLLCAGYAQGMNVDPLKGPMTSLPLAVFSMYRSPEAPEIARGYGAACVLLVLVFILFAAARVLARRKRSLRP